MSVKRKREGEDEGDSENAKRARVDTKQVLLTDLALETLLIIFSHHFGVHEILALRAVCRHFRALFPYPKEVDDVECEDGGGFEQFLRMSPLQSRRFYADAIVMSARSNAYNAVYYETILTTYKYIFPVEPLDLQEAITRAGGYWHLVGREVPLEDKWQHPDHGILARALHFQRDSAPLRILEPIRVIMQACLNEWASHKLITGMKPSPEHKDDLDAYCDAEVRARIFCVTYAFDMMVSGDDFMRWRPVNMRRSVIYSIVEYQCPDDAPHVFRLLVVYSSMCTSLEFIIDKIKRTVTRAMVTCKDFAEWYDWKVVWGEPLDANFRRDDGVVVWVK